MKQSIPQEPVVAPVQPQQQRKYGEGAALAAFRQGFAELTNALKAFPDSLPLIEQPGQLNNVPPQAVSEMGGFNRSHRSQSAGVVDQQNSCAIVSNLIHVLELHAG